MNQEQLVNEYYDKAVSLTGVDKDSAFYYLERALPIAIGLENYVDAMEILVQGTMVSGMHYDLKKHRSYLDKIEMLLKDGKAVALLDDDYAYYRNRFIYEEGHYLDKLKDFNQAKSKFLSLYNFLDKEKEDVRSMGTYDLSMLVNTTNFLAGIYMDTGKYDLSEDYFNQSLSFVRTNTASENNHLLRATNRLRSQLYINMGRHEKADSILQQVLAEYKEAYKENHLYKNSVLVVYQRIVDNLVKQNSLEKALAYLDESKNYLEKEDSFYKKVLLLYGDIYLEMGQPEKAEENYAKALRIFQEYREDEPHQDVAEVYGKLARLHLKGKDPRKGLQFINDALENSGSRVPIKKLAENPPPEQVFSKRQLLHLLDLKIQLLQLSQEISGRNENQKASLETVNDLLKTFALLKKEFHSKLDKQFLVETAYPIFHRMLAMVYEGYQKNADPQLLQLALNISEQNKDFVLLESLRSANATEYADIPKNVLNREAWYRAEISHLEKRFFETKDGAVEFSKPLFALKQEYYAFLDSLKIKHPEYHDLRYGSKTVQLSQIRNSALRDDEVLVIFTLDENHLYTIVIDKEKEGFFKLPFGDTDREMVSDFYGDLSKPSVGGHEDFLASGQKLFDKILKVPLKGFDSDNLTIISDGILHYLPFEVLSVQGTFLLKEKTIGYANSVASILELKAKQNENNERLLAFAPSFDNETTVAEVRFEFGRLLYNDDEVGHLKSFYDSDIFLDQKATLQNFKENSPKYAVLHLATHASANDEYPDYSYLAFSKQTDRIQDNMLYIKDLYNTHLNADMVVLSACQTGIGKLQKGQGMLSLSKGFYYAGAKSLVNTLWKINDKSSVKLMEFFYEGLSSGKTKKEALRDAKLKYLSTTEDDLLKHPYYWSAFVVSGDTSPISKTIEWPYFLGGTVLLLLLSTSIYYKRKSKSALSG